MQDHFRYKITDRLGEIFTQPLGANDFTIEWSKDTDAGKRVYTEEFGGEIMFKGEAFQRLLRTEKSIYRCENQNVTIDRKCIDENGVETYKNWFNGVISLNSGEWDLDKCTVKIKFEQNKIEKCFEDNKSKTFDFFKAGLSRYNVDTQDNYNVEFEELICTRNTPPNGTPSGTLFCGTGTPEAGNWTETYRRVSINDLGTFEEVRWSRKVYTRSCIDVAPSETAILIQDNCLGIFGNRKYADLVTTFNCKYIPFNTEIEQGYLYTCEVVGSELSDIKTIPNGVFLNDAIQAIVLEYCPEITVKSDFLQINPENPSSINYVTNTTTKVDKIMLFQKSDVKRPNALNKATKLEWTFEKLMEALKFMFNLDWRIENDQFVIEHVSFFNKKFGIDATEKKYEKFLKGKRKYTYKNEDIPEREEWIFKEASYGDFVGRPILYNYCQTEGSKKIIKSYALQDVTTDVEFVLQNPDSESEYVEDAGIVFIATKLNGAGKYYILQEAGILDGSKLNNTLSNAILQRDYQKYERPLPRGIMNGIQTNFYSVKNTKQGEVFTIPLDCKTNFDPDDLIKTHLGYGEVDKAVFNFKTCMLELTLLYNSFEDLEENTAPVATNKVLSMIKNNTLEINVRANGTDENLDRTTTHLLNQPSNGTAQVLSNGNILFTPNNDYVGNVAFTYYLVDEWSVKSNNALITITIKEPNQPPVANDDFYIGKKDNILTVNATNGVLANDTDDTGNLTVSNYDSTTANGGIVVMNPNGSFTYTPPVNFEGIDTFNYTALDEQLLTGSAVVHITVIDQNKPITRPDNYVTRKNFALTATGTQTLPKLTANDYTLSGNNQNFTTNPETKTTTQGGSVTINNDGTFTYTPAFNFTGVDSFDYTAINAYGSATGIATINVIEPIYIKLVKENSKFVSNPIICDGFPSVGGGETKEDIVLYFYQNSQGTIPKDVTGLNLKARINEGTKLYNNSNYTYQEFSTNVLNGTKAIIRPEQITNSNYYNCSGITTGGVTKTFNLLSSPMYVII